MRYSPLVLLLVVACKKPPPPPPPPPPMCATVEHGSDTITGEVLCALKDADNDEIDDAVDRCLEHAEVHNGLLDRDGCPDPDRDLDLIVDSEDICPDLAGEPPDGCPEQDKDADTLADHLDACPNEPEDIDGDHDDDGCPEGEQLTVARPLADQLAGEFQVATRRGSIRPTKRGRAALEQAVAIIRGQEELLVRVQIIAHVSRAEAKGAAAGRLAWRRARSIARTLVDAGLENWKIEYVPTPGSKVPARVDISLFETLASE